MRARMPAVPISEIVAYTGGRYDGPADRMIEGVAPLAEASGTQLTFLSNPKYAPQLASTKAAAILVPEQTTGDDDRFIRVADPYFAVAQVLAKFFAFRPVPIGISPRASIASSANVGKGVSIGPFSTIADDGILGAGVIVDQNVSIESGSVNGDGSVFYPQGA